MMEILTNSIEINEETEQFEGFLFEFDSSTVDDVDGRCDKMTPDELGMSQRDESKKIYRVYTVQI